MIPRDKNQEILDSIMRPEPPLPLASDEISPPPPLVPRPGRFAGFYQVNPEHESYRLTMEALKRAQDAAFEWRNYRPQIYGFHRREDAWSYRTQVMMPRGWGKQTIADLLRGTTS